MKERYVFLDGLRGIAAIMVAIYHFTQHSDAPLMPNAYFAVDLFFVLSGFVIAKAYRQRVKDGMPFAAYASLRLKRLYPMFAVGLMAGAAALLLKIGLGQSDFTVTEAIWATVVNAVYLPFLSSKMFLVGSEEIGGVAFPANNPSWTLFFELYVNFVFFWVWRSTLYSTSRLAKFWGLFLAVFVAAIFLGWGGSGWGISPGHMLIGADRALYGFSAGVLIAGLPPYKVSSRAQAGIGVVITVGFVAICALPATNATFLAAVLAAPVLVWGGSMISMPPLASWVGNWLGEISYPLYCIHFPILMAADALGLIQPGYLSPLIWASLAVLSAGILARWVDKPIRKMLRREPGVKPST